MEAGTPSSPASCHRESWTSDSLTGASAPHTLPMMSLRAARADAGKPALVRWNLGGDARAARTSCVKCARARVCVRIWRCAARAPLMLLSLPCLAARDCGRAARERRAAQVDAPRARPAHDAPPRSFGPRDAAAIPPFDAAARAWGAAGNVTLATVRADLARAARGACSARSRRPTCRCTASKSAGSR